MREGQRRQVSKGFTNARTRFDDEVATMLQLEKSYAASAKLIATVNAMLQSLLDAVR